ncbi:glycosyl hydrolase BNR repeat-containing protein [Emticicia oligotrophica DSM 17448]|uniref:Glycosyl hydrolase BNR repeat-containing protein n=1 Tax=Emticicia oligotrophica (strain DSM 17448 / CIP 109782 / MTCC 6937 / GPTSA100-15) TaxID=929562 RepID=A0ABM5N7A6_EMTOG|nr:sialidase family protein [Emticicia oligotrophica]AFK05273.1 glycosyl hydrolase BNR repeat-containing protein [Emticicia oligotrophica DSM 17448]
MKFKIFSFFFSLISLFSYAQNFSPKLFDSMKWRMIGPHRGGRTVGAVGVPQKPNVFYIGVNNGGVWKTTDYGRTWFPIFDDQPTGSVGDVAVAPSNPNVIYVASGEGIQRPDLSVGNGIYKSTDEGKTWVNTGLKDGQQIGGLAIDPTNENRVFAAVLGHPYGPNTERGVYRTTNGGKTWERVLYKDENTGAIQVTIDPKNPNIVYADLWAARQGPWENGAWQGPESGLYKSTDGGNTWKKLTKGLPTYEQGLGRIGFCIAPSDTKRMYATVDSPEGGGVFKSNDGGESWTLVSQDPRIWGRGSDFAEVKVHPNNPDIVFSADVDTWKSEDGGKTWTAFRGAPGGDDYHRLWINPNNPDIMLLAADQGAIITVNGGETFSSWYNQPTAQFYHVSTDNAFPYNVYGGQQESGSVGIASRGNDGLISFRDWHPVGVEEYGYVAADPLDPNIIYGGKITKYDKRTGQTQNIAPEAVRSGKYRFIRTAPVLFSPVDKKSLFFAGNVLFKTKNGGDSWEVISPDLTRDTYDFVPSSIGVFTTESLKKMNRRGVIYSVAPSPKDINTIWAGTDDGLIHITSDGGKTWTNVTPPTPKGEKDGYWYWSKISQIDAGQFDKNVAYVAVNRIRLDDLRPHIFRTKDGGKTWDEIVNGLPNEPINTVREDPYRKGLLFAGSENAVYVSFDEGENWQSLRLNMPATSIRDLVIKDDDIVVGTHGRSFWILDDITPLRQVTSEVAKNDAFLYKPQNTYRVRWSTYTDTPLPQEEPQGQNPPDGAIINYFLKEKIKGVVKLEIYDASKKIIRSFSSDDKPYELPDLNIPHYWIRPQQILSAEAGSHRFVWDLHYEPLNLPPTYPISAVYKNTAPDPTSPWVLPGYYTALLTVNGKVFEQNFLVKMDPRVKTAAIDLKLQHDLSLACYEGRKKVFNELEKMKEARQRVRMTDEGLKIFNQKEEDLKKIQNNLSNVQNILQESDNKPTTQVVTSAKDLLSKLEVLLK